MPTGVNDAHLCPPHLAHSMARFAFRLSFIFIEFRDAHEIYTPFLPNNELKRKSQPTSRRRPSENFPREIPPAEREISPAIDW